MACNVSIWHNAGLAKPGKTLSPGAARSALSFKATTGMATKDLV